MIPVKRYELKYYVSYKDYLILSKTLSHFLEKDQYFGKNGYFIRSLYFDTLHNSAFNEKIAGVEKRKKFRLRIYDLNDKSVKFEIKHKMGNIVSKETTLISKKDALSVQAGNYEVLKKYNDPLLNKIYFEFKKELYKPIVIVDYTREPYILNMNNIRITFDYNLKSVNNVLNLFDSNLQMKTLLDGRRVIMEIKYDGFLPAWIKSILKTIPAERCAISKYCLGRLSYYKL